MPRRGGKGQRWLGGKKLGHDGCVVAMGSARQGGLDCLRGQRLMIHEGMAHDKEKRAKISYDP